MNGFAYYNENDAFAAQWLRNLIAAGHIAPGEVDERSIVDVRGDDLRGFTQCHFFAGIGIWSYALRLAGWPDNKPVWTGSCPCQPFSAAGRSGGFGDERHLWPYWARLIGEYRPDVIFGEQVASGDGLAWLDFVCADLEAAGYAVGAVDTCAAGFGAQHIRQRLYFVADASGTRTGRYVGNAQRTQTESDRKWGANGRDIARGAVSLGATSKLANTASTRQDGTGKRDRGAGIIQCELSKGCTVGDMGDASGEGLQGRSLRPREESGKQAARARSATNGFWRDADWLPCIDGKARAVEPSTSPLAHGATSRVGRLRAYGNAICAPQAAEFIRAYREISLTSPLPAPGGMGETTP